MKKFILAMVAMVMMTLTTASAMSYEQARQQALFLTDKMAYELNLTDDQYEAAYEVNLDYLMGVNTYDDLYGAYWRQRNADLSYILLDWQYNAFVAASYFYRPLYWNAGYWHFGIYARYPRRDYFFFGRPTFYVSYHGAHSWRMNGGRSWYHGRTFGAPRPGGAPRMGMRDGFNRGDYGRGHTFGNSRPSSTRTTVGNERHFGNYNPNNNLGNGNSRPNGSFGNGNTNRPSGSFGNSSRPSGSFGNSRPSNGVGTNSGSSFGGNRSGSFGNSSRPSGSSMSSGSRPSGSFTPRSTTPSSSSFGGNRSFGSGSSSFGSSRPSMGSSSSRSFGGGSTSHSSGSNGGSHFGGRR